ncbi:MAG TPA: carbonic anhydrase [Alphaproteobacteria bacterium]|nr:carbonic anhydrase [Alphaproteobacteria bacterium]
MERLLEGFRRFRDTYWRSHRELFQTLATKGQKPRALVIACSDSRVDPQLIFGTTPGEVFVIRNIANVVPPYAPNAEHHGTSAALEFAVRTLAVEHVIVLGHSHCGGIAALLRGPTPDSGDFVAPWMEIVAPARERALAAAAAKGEPAQRLCEHEGIKISLENLKTFPWLRERLAQGGLKLHGWHFDIEQGDLSQLDSTGTFRPI